MIFKMSVTKRKFTKEFKLKIVSEIESGIKTRAAATREYELSEGLVAKWIVAYRKDPQNAFSGGSSQIERLEAKISQLEWALGRKSLEVEVLKDMLDKLGVKKGN